MKTKIYIVAINNLSHNSFSEKGGSLDEALVLAQKQREAGADYIDFGAQSTAPGAVQIDEESEKTMIENVVRAHATSNYISVDTTRGSVAEIAARHGVAIINDISGFRFDRNILNPVAHTKEMLYVLTHSQGDFTTLHKNYEYRDVVKEIESYFKKNIAYLNQLGVTSNQIILDFGFGFSKSSQQNIELLQRLDELPPYRKVMIGISRKKFIRNISTTSKLPELDSITTMFHMHILERLIDKGTEEIYIRTHNVQHAVLLRKVLTLLTT